MTRISNFVAKAPTVVATNPIVVATAPAVAEALSSSAAPLSFVVASAQEVLVLGVDASVQLLRIPSELSSALLVVAGVAPAQTPSPGVTDKPLAMATDDPMPTAYPLTLPQLLSGGSAPPVRPAMLGDLPATGPTRSVSSSAPPLPAMPGDAPSSARSTVELVIGAFVASASLLALAALALPGICGLLITCATGIRVGYRQAKLRTRLPAATARFANSGPLGVVRSGSMISLRPHARRDCRPGPSPEASLPARATDYLRAS